MLIFSSKIAGANGFGPCLIFLLAPFWDDLEVINNDSIRVYTKI